MNYIELFAGCGGLSLGLKSQDFELVMANELSPMAAETYALNLLGEDFEDLSARSGTPKKTLWLASKFARENLSARRREDPRPSGGEAHCDLRKDGSNLPGSLVVGSLTCLNDWLAEHTEVAKRIKDSFGKGELDLVSGGPPCQSFSMAGLRRKNCEKNTLPWEFAKFVDTTRPRFVLLENVTGILKPFTDEAGDKYYAWIEVAKAFAGIDYYPLCLHVNAKYVGVAQNRQRFILLGLRHDVYRRLKKSFDARERMLFARVETFFNAVRNQSPVGTENLGCWDVDDPVHARLFERSFLAPLVCARGELVSAQDAIDDIKAIDCLMDRRVVSDHVRKLNKQFSHVVGQPPDKPENHEHRTSNGLVRSRFGIYQVLNRVDAITRSKVQARLRGRKVELNERDWLELKAEFGRAQYMPRKFSSKRQLIEFIDKHQTKKRTQKALLRDEPAPAAVSIPDDACHYEEPRTLTVRELARLQSFPDAFVFRSKTTTGGHLRRFEVPQYTQVGNAVPPLLGRALGAVIKNLHEKLVSEAKVPEPEEFELEA